MNKVLLIGSVFLGILSVMFLGGLASAAWEIRGERCRGLEPTRPYWERRARLAAQGRFPYLRGLLAGLRTRTQGPGRCPVCGGPRIVVPALDLSTPGGIACVAWEEAQPWSIRAHDEVGGYVREAAA